MGYVSLFALAAAIPAAAMNVTLTSAMRDSAVVGQASNFVTATRVAVFDNGNTRITAAGGYSRGQVIECAREGRVSPNCAETPGINPERHLSHGIICPEGETERSGFAGDAGEQSVRRELEAGGKVVSGRHGPEYGLLGFERAELVGIGLIVDT